MTALLASAAAAAGDAAAGKLPFLVHCASCHGETGRGDGPLGPSLRPPPGDFTTGTFRLDTNGDGRKGTDADLRNVILEGSARFGGSVVMGPFRELSDADLANIVAYIRALAE